MREVDLLPLFDRSQRALGKSSRIIVDSRSACLAEAGELYHLREHLPSASGENEGLLVELGSLLDDEGQPVSDAVRSDQDEITVL